MGCGASKIDPENVDLRHFRMERILGAGGFGKVHAAFKKTGPDKGQLYAIKELSKLTIIEKKAHKEVFAEMKMLTALQFPLICNVHYAFQDERNLYLVMDLALGGDLRYRLNQIVKAQQKDPKSIKMSVDELRFDMFCVLMSLKYLHSLRIVFRDLKPDNILIKKNGYILLTDFGISKHCPNDVCVDRSGTHGYMAPEVYRGNHEHTFNSDIFALGVTMYELLTAQRPFKPGTIKDVTMDDDEEANLSRERLPGNKLRKIEGIPTELCDFMDAALTFNKEKRLDVAQAMAHPFFNKYKEQDFLEFKEKTFFLPDTSVANCDSTNLEVQEIFQDKSALPKPTPEQQPDFEGYKFDMHVFKRESASVLYKGDSPEDLAKIQEIAAKQGQS